MNVAYLCLGGNLDNREANMAEAVVRINGLIGNVMETSSLYETQAWGGAEQPNYLNQVVKVKTDLSAEELLFQCLEIEKAMGRNRKVKWENRVIDIDILFFNNEVLETPTLKVPHPLMQERRFVLQPLADVAAEVMHPVLHKSVLQMLADCKDNSEIIRLN